MYLSIIDVRAMDDYKLLLVFENNEKRVFDVKPYLNIGIFSALKDINMFKSVKVSFDSIEWSNNADLDPEFLYNESKKIL